MKKLLALLLCLSFLLSACAQTRTAQSNEEKEAFELDGVSAKLLGEFALAAAALPELPAEPSEEELYAAYEKLDYDKMGAEAYQKAEEELWEKFDARSRAYSDAVKALRGDGVDPAMTPALLEYSTRTAAQLLTAAEENVIYSPANLYMALSMLSETVGGETRAQLLGLLGSKDEETARAAANAIWRTLYREGDQGRTLLANSLWLREGDYYKTETVERLASDYYASVYCVPMETGDADKAVQAWLNANTGGLLREEASGVTTDAETVMLLLSALYFKDQWRDPFETSATEEAVFTAADGTEQRVDFMHGTQERAGYLRGENYTVAQLRFRGGESMIFLLPDEGTALSDVLGSAEALRDLFAGPDGAQTAQTAKLRWSVPKFNVKSNLELSEALKTMGVTDAFDAARADFSPLADFNEPVAVTRVLHAARVTIDEEGCEAAAYTALIANATAAPPAELPVVEMNLARPFAFAITGADGLPLFTGAVNTME